MGRLSRILSLGFVLCAVAGAAWADGKLKAYRAPLAETSISGISSGAFMAVQFGVAWSSIVKGVGVVAGGPYYCAETTLIETIVSGGLGPIFTATGPCMSGPPGDLAQQFRETDGLAAHRAIDAPAHMVQQKFYLFHGYNDAVVSQSVTDSAAAYYSHYLGAASGNLFYQTTLGAGHSLVVALAGDKKLDACDANAAPYIDQCGYDQAGIILQHIYGALNAPATQLSGEIKSFDQAAYAGADDADLLSLADKGFVYVPAACARGQPCRVHVVLHGCHQDVGTLGRLFVETTGYNRWADSNHIIVLYPQAKASDVLPFNPDACWDWWGYVTYDDSYVTKTGRQIAAIKRMIDALTDPKVLAPAADAGPARLLVNDRSDASVDLVWTAVARADSYTIYRAGPDGVFARVGEATGLSFADSGLTPQSQYAWRVAPVVGGVEQPPSNDTIAATMARPAPCDNPGSCPLPQ